MTRERVDERLAEMLGSVRGIVFDKDGTLIDLDARWVPFFTRVVHQVAERSGDPAMVVTLSAVLGLDGERLRPDMPAAVESLEQIRDRMVTQLRSAGHDEHRAGEIVHSVDFGTGHGPVRPIGPVRATLVDLRARRFPVAIATTDGRQNTEDELAALGMTAFVDTMRCGDDQGPVKPDPMVLVSIAAEWGIDPAALLFVGDSRQDLMTARAAGCPFVARCDRDRAPSWVVEADAVIADIAALVAP